MNDVPAVRTGQRIPVGEFFWIQPDDFIDFQNPAHGNDSSHPHRGTQGSVDVGCTLHVLAVIGSYAIVRLERPEMPFGALAPIGTVFRIKVARMESWLREQPDLTAAGEP